MGALEVLDRIYMQDERNAIIWLLNGRAIALYSGHGRVDLLIAEWVGGPSKAYKAYELPMGALHSVEDTQEIDVAS